ncbi:MAG: DUF1080 domain-containing protein [Gemmatimonadetes bacterium]|nr:DUF1080 domain-containing protein [Gemmatimonadota bacterium]
MKRVLGFLAIVTLVANSAAAQSALPPIVGRWDLTIDMPGLNRSGWLEVHRSGGRTLVGQFVGVGGSARPISRVDFRDGEMRFSIPPQWESTPGDQTFVARLEGDSLKGTMTLGDGRVVAWRGTRAPSLRRTGEPKWGAPIRLLGARDLTGWRLIGGTNEWEVVDGVLRNRKSGGNLATERSFNDFKLHLEFRHPPASNSGVYLRGRYEVQIEDARGPDAEPDYGVIGAVYGFIAPSRIAARPAGEWQTMDITLVGRMVTVVLNGQTVICDREIPGITGGALDSNEGAPGPLLLQGDHGPVDFRNIVITPAL